MKAKQFYITVLAGLTTLTMWELILKPKIKVKEQPPQAQGFDWWPFD